MILIRILAFLAIVAGFVFATRWKMGVVEASRTQEVVTIQGEYEAHGRPVVVYAVDRGALHDSQKLTFRPHGNRSLEGYISADLRRTLRVGQRVELLNGKGYGQIQSISAEPELLTGLFRLVVRVNQVSAPLPDQVIAEVKIRETKVSARVPKNAISRKAGQDYAWKVEDSRAFLHPVRLGRSDELFYEVKDGLQAGDLVVTLGHRYLNDRQRVRVVETEKSKLDVADRR